MWPLKAVAGLHSRTHKRSGESNIKLSIFKGGVDGSRANRQWQNKQLRSPEKKSTKSTVLPEPIQFQVSTEEQLSKTSTSKLSQSTTQSNINIDQY